jgi:hypothetical protein
VKFGVPPEGGTPNFFFLTSITKHQSILGKQVLMNKVMRLTILSIVAFMAAPFVAWAGNWLLSLVGYNNFDIPKLLSNEIILGTGGAVTGFILAFRKVNRVWLSLAMLGYGLGFAVGGLIIILSVFGLGFSIGDSQPFDFDIFMYFYLPFILGFIAIGFIGSAITRSRLLSTTASLLGFLIASLLGGLAVGWLVKLNPHNFTLVLPIAIVTYLMGSLLTGILSRFFTTDDSQPVTLKLTNTP